VRLPVVAGILITCNLSISRAAEQISDSVLAQIRALQAEKASRSALHRKLDSQFVFELKRGRGQAIASGMPDIQPNIDHQPDGRVLVDIKADVTAPLLEAIIRGAGTIIHSSPRFQSIRAQVRLDQLENLAADPSVKFIQRALEGKTHTGSVNSEADTTHRAAPARNTFAVGGSGVKIGVLSDGIQYLDNSQYNGDLGNVTILPGQSGSGREGTAMLELIKDLAPDAELYFATAFNGPASFAENILNLRSNGCDIIVDDVIYFAEPPFQDGIIAQAVNSVTADGALFFSSAGNQGSVRYGTSSTWEGDFVDSGQSLEGYGGKIHAFGSTNYNVVLGTGFGVDLFWADPAGASTNDYDLYLLNSSGTSVLYVSNNPQTGTQDPYERIGSYPPAGSRVVVVKNSGAPRFLRVQTLAGSLKVRTGGATYGHSAATNAFSVAAVSAFNSFPDSFDTFATVENFSADGPRRAFFQADGAPITPGNFTSSGGHVRPKPDITAADGAMTTVPGFQPFYGTSAAAPHAAAIAALLWSYDPTLSPTQIRTALTSSALDIESPGFDINSGAGIVMADSALATLPPRPVIAAGSATLVYESHPNNALDPGETVTVTLSLTNRGSADTTNLIGTLLNTGGVSFASSPQNYGTLSAYGGVGIQTFTFLANGSCGDTAVTTLQLQDGTTNLGSVTFSFKLGAPVIPLAENFDHLTPPSLPGGWTVSSSGAGLPWRTTNSWSDTGYNSAFAIGPGKTVSDKSLISPTFQVISSGAQVSFWQYQRIGYANGGGVLEISTNGSPYQDILDMGGVFVTNGYNGYAWSGSSSPLEGRAIWSGVNVRSLTVANLPTSTLGQNVRLRFRFATGFDDAPSPSWHIDSVMVTAGMACGITTSNNVVVNSASSPSSVAFGGSVAYAIKVGNTGPNNATNVNVTNTLPSGFVVQSMEIPSGVILNSSNSNTLDFAIPILPGGDNKTITISGVLPTTGLFTNRANVSRSDGGLSTISNAVATTSVFMPAAFAIDAAVLEGDAGTTNLIFKVSLATPPFTNAAVRFATVNQTALAGKDYFSTNGILTFAPGVTTQSFAVRVIGNLLNETNKHFAVNLSSPTNLTIIKGQGVGTILNEDPYPYLSISDATIAKPNSGISNATFIVRLSSPSGRPISFAYNTREASAIENLDFLPAADVLTFAPGQTNLSIQVPVTNHVTVKPAQTFNVTLWNQDYAKLDRSEAVGTIVTALPGRLDHFSWESVPSPQSNGYPFNVAVTARDFFGNVATNFNGVVTLRAFSVDNYRTNAFYDSSSVSHSFTPGTTRGYEFTPKTNMLVTHFRLYTYSASKVCLWNNEGTLLAQQTVNTNNGWVEAPLTTPVSLLAGRTYRLSAFNPSLTYATYLPDHISDFPDAVVSQNYYAPSDTFPDVVDAGSYRASLDIRYTVALPTVLALTPTNSGNFSNSLWSGAVTVQLPATNVVLMASAATGQVGISQPFNVTPAPGQITHFAWDSIEGLQPVSNAFSVKLTALDFYNQSVSNYSGGSVALSASVIAPATRTNLLLGNVVTPDFYDEPDRTFGYSFTPRTNLTVTHLRNYFGNKVSIWTDAGTLLVSRVVPNATAVWAETPLITPIQLFAGQTYRIGARATGRHYFRNDMATNFADVLIKQAYYSYGDSFPSSFNGTMWDLVDFRYTVAFQASNAVAISPTNSGAFTNGSWFGNVLVNRLVTNLTLRADDRLGHVGSSNPFNVGFVPGLLERFIWSNIPSPQTNAGNFPVTITAVDHFNNVVTNFNGAVTLSVQTGAPTPVMNLNTSSNFNQGVWTGSLYVFPAGNNVVLRAQTTSNLFGLSNPFNVVNPPRLPPLLQGTVLNSGTMQFAWSAVPGFTYQVQYATNLAAPDWTNLGGPIAATNVSAWLIDSVGSDPRRFYRIMILP